MRSVVKKSVAVLMSLSAIATPVVGCGGGAGSTDEGGTQQVGPQSGRFDGKTLFKGMFLGVGPAAKAFPEIWEHPKVVARMKEAKHTAAEVEQKSEGLIARVEKVDPTFFERFGRDIQSGDHVAIQEMLAEAKSTLQKAADAWNQESTTRATSVDEGPVANMMDDGWYYRYEYVALDVYGVAYVAAVAIIVVIDFNVAPTDTESSSLRDDAWVNMLAGRDFACVAARGDCK